MIYELDDTSKVEKLFAGWEETEIYSCLQKVMGKICVTDPENPKSAAAFLGNTGYYAGEPDQELVLHRPEDFSLMIPQNDAWADLIRSAYPGADKLTRFAIKKETVFDTEKLEKMAAKLPDGYELKWIDSELYDMCLADDDFEDFVWSFGSKEKFLELGRGAVIMKEGKIVSGASSFSRYNEGIEIEVDTAEEEQGKGLATAACAALILSCLKEGLYPSWDAANITSVRIAEKLGYEFDREYTCFWVYDGKQDLEETGDIWNGISDSEWYQSLRTDEKLDQLKNDPQSAFHPDVFGLIRKYMPDLRGKRVLLPSSGDNHEAFAFALMGAKVTSADISSRQLENAKAAADKLELDIEFRCENTMSLAGISGDLFDLIYTSEGTTRWTNDLPAMYKSFERVLKSGGTLIQYDIHPFTRPFSNKPFAEPRIIRKYGDASWYHYWALQDIINSQIGAGLTLCEIAELPSVDASFWYTYDELKTKSEDDLKDINNCIRNPMAALPSWISIVSKKE